MESKRAPGFARVRGFDVNDFRREFEYLIRPCCDLRTSDNNVYVDFEVDAFRDEFCHGLAY